MADTAPGDDLSSQKAKISTLLDNLNSCLSSAGSSLPRSKNNDESDVSIQPPADGISLLDTKSEILLSYLHNLVFLILFQLRSILDGSNDKSDAAIGKDDIVKKLVQLRVYLERGVRPLESRLQYQIDKVIKAAEDAERAQKTATTKKPKKDREAAESDASESERSDDSEAASSDEDEDIDEMAFRPNLSAFAKAQQAVENEQKSKADHKKASEDGIYRPPKIKPTALPTTDSRPEDRESRRVQKSRVIDEFVANELSSAPVAEPSIGSTIKRGGRHIMSQKERELEREKQEYEETHFVRLQESKKERAKQRARSGANLGSFGGEEFRLLSDSADRIQRLTQRAHKEGALEKSRKRRFTEDGPRGDGTELGQMFEKRRKKVERYTNKTK
ncbi:hypothetical protein VTN49DRAFT_6280 [Thermomyces lanuginosus]|uniref:uncharacterized protein n=1 Tax=Thermomyces lanuginosus TaxID=5541 RepID=UPI003743DDB1